jgi:hypothetical protein
MTVRVCATAGCPAKIKAGSRSGRCPDCERLADKQRGTSAERGYGARHRRLSERERAAAVGTRCALCGEVMNPGEPLALDHTPDRSAYRGVVHLSCNASDGAQRGNAMR